MSKQVYDVTINVKSATMHVLATTPEEAFKIAEENLDNWYNDFYWDHEDDFDDNPSVHSLSENIFIEDEEDEPLYGSSKFKTLGDYEYSDDEEDEEDEEYNAPNQLEMNFQ